MLRGARMAGLVKPQRGIRSAGQRRQWAGSANWADPSKGRLKSASESLETDAAKVRNPPWVSRNGAGKMTGFVEHCLSPFE